MPIEAANAVESAGAAAAAPVNGTPDRTNTRRGSEISPLPGWVASTKATIIMSKSAFVRGHKTGQKREKTVKEQIFSIPYSDWSRGHAAGSKERKKHKK
jgi:hypothetical protein